MRLWCELAWLGGDEPDAGVVIDIDGDRISSVATRARRRADAERLPG